MVFFFFFFFFLGKLKGLAGERQAMEIEFELRHKILNLEKINMQLGTSCYNVITNVNTSTDIIIIITTTTTSTPTTTATTIYYY